MAYSYVVYTGNGATTQYSVPFPYIRKEHVYVSINYTNTTAFTWVNASTIQMNSAPANGARVEVRRTTPVSAPLVDFADGSTLVAADLDTVNLQQTYINQEQDDQFQDAVFINTQGLLDAGGKRITNVGNPTAAQDATTKSYTDNWFNTYGESYLGSYATDPATKPNGGALTVGVWYFNTTANRIKIYNGQIWTDGASPSGLVRWKKTAAGGETSLSGADDNSFTLAYTPALEQLYINGALQTRAVDYLATNGTSVTGLAALTAGDVVEVLSFNNWVAATVPDASVTNAKVAAGAGIAASKLGFVQAGTGAAQRTVESKLQDVVSVKDFGAVGDGVADDTAAIQAAVNYIGSVGGGTLVIPRGTFVLRSTITIKSTASGGIFPAESTINFIGTGATKSTIYWLGADGNGRTGTAFDWSSGVYGGFSNLRFITAAVEGHTSQLIDGFTTQTTTFAGCDSTSSVAIKHGYNGSFSIEKCDFYKFHRAVWMDLGYNRSVRDCSIMFCNVGIGTYGAATINHYLNNRIERCAIGLSFALCSTITCESNVTQANYGGCDVNIQTYTHSLHFKRQYFEASPKAVFIQGGGAGDPSVTPSGHVFDECNSISIVSQGRLNDIYLIRGLCGSVPIEHSGVDAATYYAIDCYQHSGGARVPATGYNMGVAKLYESGAAKSTVPANFGIGTTNPAGNYFSRYGLIEGTYPALAFRSTGTGGRTYSIGQDILVSDGWLTWRDETANSIRLLLDQTGRFAPGSDNTQPLGSAGNRWSEVFAGTGTINTSDAREKQDVESLSSAELRVAATLKGLVKKFRFKGAVQAKGDNARIHVGVIAQEVVSAFKAEGLDPMRYGIVCYDQWEAAGDTPAGDRYGVRYEELLAFIIAAL